MEKCGHTTFFWWMVAFLDRSLRYWNNAQIYRFAWGAPLSLLIASVIVAIIKIPKKKTSSPYVKEKRKAGTSAGLTKPAVVAAAAKLIESVGANGFSLRRLAKALGVGPTTIHFHFEGGVGSVFSAVAQQALAGVTRPFKPKEEPAAYLGELLLKILQALHARPVVAKLVVLQLSSNPLLDPLLAERLLLALGALGVPTEARPKMFRRAMGVIIEMILAECGRSSAADQKETSAQMHNRIASLSPMEFPNLTEFCEVLAADTVQGGVAKPSPAVAAEYADRLIATLSVK